MNPVAPHSEVFAVAGATGTVGGRVVHLLRQAGHPVRALVRGAERRPERATLEALGVEVVEADLAAVETLTAACAGAGTVVCTVTTMPHGAGDGLRRVDRDGVVALIAAAERAGARRFIYLSYSGGIEQPSPLHDAKRSCERALAASALAFTILRPSFFMQAWFGGQALDLARGTCRVFGEGTAPVSFVSADDVATLAARAALRSGDGIRRVLEIGGPQALAPLEAVAAVGRGLGRSLQVEHVPVGTLRAMQTSADPVQSTFGALGLAYASGDAVPGAVATAAELGVELQSMADYAATLAG